MKDTTKHIRDIIKTLPMVKAANDFVHKLEEKIKNHESKISKSKRKGSTKSTKG